MDLVHCLGSSVQPDSQSVRGTATAGARCYDAGKKIGGRKRRHLILGPEADAIRTVADLAGRRIGIGPKDSATNLLAIEILSSLIAA
jgi:hypothetical protein